MNIEPTSDGGVILTLDDATEAQVLQQLVGQLSELVAPEQLPSDDPLAKMVGIDTTPERPADPAVARLFPDAYRDDEPAATEFRRYTEHDLRQRKSRDAHRVAADLVVLAQSGSAAVDADGARAWLGCLNDLRLLLGTRLDVQEDDPYPPVTDDPRGHLLLLYHWLTSVQGTLVESLHPRHP